ncbi:Phosphatase [Oryctes borbonicus]|uniref:acid phosphatase n=1 Tax=Oryctes borbonicus TaxID=1629725 RepID=A0A0T6AZU2_9SCAR|nr:Phosphatase [Oryctes borbonicus]
MSEDTLVLLHTIFRHGERTTDRGHQYPRDPYIKEEFAPYGPGQLTNDGKKSMFDLGKVLRNIYNEYLGDEYVPKHVYAVATDYDRTKTSLQLVLASLYPPKGQNVWHEELNWQPIPYYSSPSEYDNVLGGLLEKPEFLAAYGKNFENSEAKKLFQQQHDVIEYLRKHTGDDIKYIRDVWLLLGTLVTEKQFGLTLPDWTAPVFPNKLIELAAHEYKLQTATKELKKLVFGNLVEKILNDTKAKISGKSECKIHLYSGHDCNVAHFLIHFGVMYRHFPSYASCAVLEVHLLDGKHVLKLKYRESKTTEFKYLSFPNGSQILTLEDFENSVKDLLN